MFLEVSVLSSSDVVSVSRWSLHLFLECLSLVSFSRKSGRSQSRLKKTTKCLGLRPDHNV